MSDRFTRRLFVKGSLLPAAGSVLAMGSAASAEPPAAPNPPAAEPRLPVGKIGDLSVSRLLLGGNLLTHYTHSRDLKYVYNLAARYNTEEKILQTLARAEANGVNTLVIHTVPWSMDILKKYRRERGGGIQWIICPTAPVKPGLEEYRKQVLELIGAGVDAIYLWGVHADRLAAQGKMDLIKEAVEVVQLAGVPSGVGGHDLNVVEQCEKHNIPNDFYIKTFHHHKYPTGPRPDEIKGPYREIPGYWCSDPNKTVEVMQAVEKPWIAFKVMAAGAIPPRNAIPHAFNNGADHVLAGMFDFEIAEDAAIAKAAVAKVKRTRPWRS